MKLKNINLSVDEIQDIIVNSDISVGDGKSIANIPEIPIKHLFADQIYIRQMEMKQGQIVVGAIHNHLHAWFLMKGRVLINNNGEKIEHIAPCYTVSEPGSKRFIYALEDSIFVNVHKNPSNTKDIEKLEKEIVSFDIEKFKEKTK
jgi:quercetin dioxygenase-like cupin family protein